MSSSTPLGGSADAAGASMGQKLAQEKQQKEKKRNLTGKPLQLARLLKVGTTSKFRDENCFILQMDDGSKMVLRAADRKERDTWLFAFHKSIAKIVSILLSDGYGLDGGTNSRGIRGDYSQGARPVRRASGRGSADATGASGVGSAFGMSLGMMNRISSSGVTKPGEIVFTKGERSLSEECVSPTSAGRKNSSSANSAGDAGLDDRSLPPQWRAPSTGDTTCTSLP